MVVTKRKVDVKKRKIDVRRMVDCEVDSRGRPTIVIRTEFGTLLRDEVINGASVKVYKDEDGAMVTVRDDGGVVIHFAGGAMKTISKPVDPTRVEWYARGGGISRCGPFKSQIEAVDAMRLVRREATTRIGGDFRNGRADLALLHTPAQRAEFPDDVFVWPERVEP